ncbi:hypothetical protein B0H13DRAFT_1627217, partial [Mycena leptocephala]
CTGIKIEWPAEMSFWLTFPFHRITLLGDDAHEGDLPFDLEIHERGKIITAWSKKCRKTTTLHFPHCQECDAISEHLDGLAQIARDAKKDTNYKFLRHDQLRELLIERNEQLKKLKLESLNLGRRLATFTRKMDDFECLLMAIATKDVQCIHAIIETAMRNGASVRKLPAYMMHLKAFITRKVSRSSRTIWASLFIDSAVVPCYTP